MRASEAHPTAAVGFLKSALMVQEIASMAGHSFTVRHSSPHCKGELKQDQSGL